MGITVGNLPTSMSIQACRNYRCLKASVFHLPFGLLVEAHNMGGVLKRVVTAVTAATVVTVVTVVFFPKDPLPNCAPI